MLRLFVALALGLFASPAGAVTAFVTGTITEVVINGGFPFSSVDVGDAFEVEITYDALPCNHPNALCSPTQSGYTAAINGVVITVDGETRDVGGSSEVSNITVQNDSPGDRIQIGERVLASDGTILVTLAGGVLPIGSALAYYPSGDLGALVGWDPAQSTIAFTYFNPGFGEGFFRGAIDVAPIPEPGTSLLVLGGLLALGALRRRRRA
jgi:hypothetical protein